MSNVLDAKPTCRSWLLLLLLHPCYRIIFCTLLLFPQTMVAFLEWEETLQAGGVAASEPVERHEGTEMP